MSQRGIKSKVFEQFEAKFNQFSVDRLFEKYANIGFIYPSKRAILAPYFKQICDTWRKLRTCKEELLWILTLEPKDSDDFASVSVIKQSNYGLLAQHLVSDGNPFLSLKVMLYAQYRAEHICGPDEVKSSQNWFRPNNRYAYRIFASMIDKLGDDKAMLKHYDYLHLDLSKIIKRDNPRFTHDVINGVDKELIEFVKTEQGNVFVRGEELDQEDVNLYTLDAKFKQYGLRRYRKIIKIKNALTGDVQAAIIVNRAPLGLNFSFLENRCYYIVKASLNAYEKANLLYHMNILAADSYSNFQLQKIPIVTDAHSSILLQQQGADFLRIYIQSIWLREGFSLWYEHIESFLSKIEARNKKKAG